VALGAFAKNIYLRDLRSIREGSIDVCGSFGLFFGRNKIK
jgi:hypothetical protein